MIDKNRADELERFKAAIDLRDLAAALGFQEDRSAGDPRHGVLWHSDGALLIVGIDSATGHWSFTSNQGISGTAIDLVQWREGLALGEVRRRLRPFIGKRPDRRPAASWTARPKPRPTTGNALRAHLEWNDAAVTSHPVFLERSCGIPPQILADPRFAGRHREDRRHNTVFPYEHAGALVAVDRCNRAPRGSDGLSTVYTAGAPPGVWRSRISPDDRRLVVTDSPIEAMSFHALYGDGQTRYLALRPGCDPADLADAIRALPAGSEVVIATSQGRQHMGEITHAATVAGCSCRQVGPPDKAGDWNQALQKVANQQPRRKELRRETGPEW